MKYLFALAIVLALAIPAEAGLIFRRKASGRPTPVRSAVGHVFHGCSGGSCGR